MANPQPDSPTPFGRYFLSKRIAAGGMGVVYLATARGAAGFEKTLVIKRIQPHLQSNPEFLERFIDEGKLVVQLSHGNIVQVYDMGVVDGDYFIAMEYVDGYDLRDLLLRAARADRMLPVPVVLHILRELCEGLAFAHTLADPSGRPLSIIHRDISPANVMVSRHGAVKLLDFGVAKAASKLSRSVSGTLRGKFLYMSPEQARGADLDPRSDLFSVGTLGYELLTGRRPFDASSEIRILENIQHHTPPPPSRLRAGIPEAASRIIERCLEKDPDDRFQSADALKRALASAVVEFGLVVTTSDVAELVAELAAVAPVPREPLSLDAALALQLEGASDGPAERTRTALAEGPAPRTPTPAPEAERASPMFTASQSGSTPAPVTSTTQLLPSEGPQRLFFIVLILAVGVLLFFNVRTLLRDEREVRPPPQPEARVDAQVAEELPPVAPDARVDSVPGPLVTVLASRVRRAPETAEPGPTRRSLETEVAKELPPQTARARSVTVSTDPPGAALRIDGESLGPAPRTVLVPPDRALPGVAELDGYRPEPFTLRSDGKRTVSVKLTQQALGTVEFRFFPANAKVAIDGAPLSSGGNIVRRKLPVGGHVLVVSAEGFDREERSFAVREGEKTNLGTVELGAAVRDGP